MLFCAARSIAQENDPEAHGDSGKRQAQEVTADEPERIETLWAKPGLTLNPVAISFDRWGNVYVAEGWRRKQSQVDTRDKPVRQAGGLDQDLQLQTVDDRRAQIRRWISDGVFPAARFTADSDQVRLVKDTDGDGIADTSSVFAGGFNAPESGLGAGVLWLDGKVYYTNIPNLWLLEDLDNDGDADVSTAGERRVLSEGYGVRWAFRGHDLHGLTLGPDGRIYFSIADRGYNVTTKEGKHLYGPDRGAVFRMWPNGSELERFADGLRNPQELAFDNYGNLFTGENNSDAGDKARFIHLVEGADIGWRQSVQQMPSRGVWNREGVWKTPKPGRNPAQPAWNVPTIAYVGYGPSGIAHYPGTGDELPANGSFMLANFPGQILRVDVKPNGAWFDVALARPIVTNKNAADVAWGYDGRLYVADWGQGWSPNQKGHIATLTNTKVHADPAEQAAIQEVRSLFAGGFEQLDTARLLDLLGHRDQRVRLAAQYQLAERPESSEALVKLTRKIEAAQLARIHAIWTLSMQARERLILGESLLSLLEDPDHEVRHQAVKMLADLRVPASDAYRRLLEDDHAPTRFQAAMALGHTASADAVDPLLSMLADNADRDPILRHGGAYALALLIERGEAKPQQLIDAAKTMSPSAKLGVVLALRRNSSPALVHYLTHPDPQVVAEAARAIFDQRVLEAFEPLATMLTHDLPEALQIEPVLRRAIEANVHLADQASADRLAAFSAGPGLNEWRQLALEELAQWSTQRNRDAVWGTWYPRDAQPYDEAKQALAAHIESLTADSYRKLRDLALTLQTQHLLPDDLHQFQEIALNQRNTISVRQAALQRVSSLSLDSAITLCRQLVDGGKTPGPLKDIARAMLTTLDTKSAIASYADALDQGTLAEQQNAIKELARLDQADSKQILNELGSQLLRGTLAQSIQLDVYLALQTSDDSQLRYKANQYASQLPAGGLPWPREAVLAGGDVERGRLIFQNHEAAECQRCHLVSGRDVTVGPNLVHIGSQRSASYLYDSLVEPSRDIAEGFAAVTVTRTDGSSLSGRLKTAGSGDGVSVVDAEGKTIDVPEDQIASMTTTEQSQMPAMGDKLTSAEARDVLAYLVSLQDEAIGPASSDAGPLIGVGETKRTRLFSPLKNIRHAVVLPLVLAIVLIPLGLIFVFTWLKPGPQADRT